MGVPETASTNWPLMKSLVNLTSTLGTSNPLPPLPFAAAMAPPPAGPESAEGCVLCELARRGAGEEEDR